MDVEERAARLHDEADTILAEHGLLEMVSRLGSVFVGGSYATDLIMWPDIDLYVSVNESASLSAIFALGAEIAERFCAWKCFFVDDRASGQSEPAVADDPRWRLNGIFFGIWLGDHRRGAWKFDIWFVDERMFKVVREESASLAARLTRETRRAILRIKEPFRGSPPYQVAVRSWWIYDAVLEHGVRSYAEFEAYMADRMADPDSAPRDDRGRGGRLRLRRDIPRSVHGQSGYRPADGVSNNVDSTPTLRTSSHWLPSLATKPVPNHDRDPVGDAERSRC